MVCGCGHKSSLVMLACCLATCVRAGAGLDPVAFGFLAVNSTSSGWYRMRTCVNGCLAEWVSDSLASRESPGLFGQHILPYIYTVGKGEREKRQTERERERCREVGRERERDSANFQATPPELTKGEKTLTQRGSLPSLVYKKVKADSSKSAS